MKICSKCKEKKELIEFGKVKANKDGYHGQCKACIKAKNKAYNENNKDKLKDNKKVYYEDNKEKFKATRKAYVEANKDKLKAYHKAYSKAYYQDNKDKRKAYNKAYREDNKDKRKAYYQDNKGKVKAYYETNKDKINKRDRERRKNEPLFRFSSSLRRRTTQAFRRSRWNKNSPNEIMLGCTFEEAFNHIEKQFYGGLSWNNKNDWHIDHIIPLASATTEQELINLCHYSNLQPLWAIDNLSKNDTMPKVSKLWT